MKKVIKFFNSILLITILASISGCGRNRQPSEVQLYSGNILNYLNFKVKFDSASRGFTVSSNRVNSSIRFSDWCATEILLIGNAIFEGKPRTMNFTVHIFIDNYGNSEQSKAVTNSRVDAFVFTNYKFSTVSGSVVAGTNSSGQGKVTYVSNEEQQRIYDSYLEQIPEPGDENYDKGGCVYKYQDYANQKDLALVSVSESKVICASRSRKHNNEKVTQIGSGSPLFAGYINGVYRNRNDEISSFEMSKYTTVINREAFSHASSLKTMKFSSTVEKIDYGAFQFSDLSSGIELPTGLKEIGEFAFQGSKLKTIFIPKSVTKIGAEAFANCDELTTIYCEAASKPSGWDYDWDLNYSKGSFMHYRHNVIWGSKRN